MCISAQIFMVLILDNISEMSTHCGLPSNISTIGYKEEPRPRAIEKKMYSRNDVYFSSDIHGTYFR